MTLEKEWPVLQSRARTGKAKYWQVRVLRDGETAHVEREWWVEGGKHQTAAREVKGKNVGRSNETTPLAQALFEAEAEFKKQLDDGYQEVGQTSTDGAVAANGQANAQTGLLLPMLAHDFTKRGKSMSWPCFAQPKLDGFRCMYNSSIGFWSRGGKPFDQAVDLNHLHFDTGGLTFDGELMLPAPHTFQQTCQAIKKQREETRLLQFHIFDVVLDGEPFEKRDEFLFNFLLPGDKPWNVLKVETHKIATMEDAQRYQALFMAEGYEGLILRDPQGTYEVGNRSPGLQKFKVFQDEEYQIIGVKDGVGREAGAAIFTCAVTTPSGLKEFDVRPRGSYELRKLWWEQREELVGRFLKVRYQNLTDEGLPRFPVGIELRDMTPAGQPIL